MMDKQSTETLEKELEKVTKELAKVKRKEHNLLRELGIRRAKTEFDYEIGDIFQEKKKYRDYREAVVVLDMRLSILNYVEFKVAKILHTGKPSTYGHYWTTLSKFEKVGKFEGKLPSPHCIGTKVDIKTLQSKKG